MKIYLAAPLFTQAERRWNRELKLALEARGEGVIVHLPQDSELEFRDGKPDFAAVFRGDVEGMDLCDVIIAILDGSDSDSGTAWECGYAYARGMPVVGVRTDFRMHEDSHLNAMLSQSMKIVYQESFDEDIEALAEKIILALGDT